MKIRPLLKESLFLLKVNGFNPLDTSTNADRRAYFSLFMYLTLSVDIFLDLILKCRLLECADGFSAIIALYQINSKMFTLIVNRKILRKVVYTINEKFWKPNKCGRENEMEIPKRYKLFERIMKAVLLSYITTFLAYYIQPIIFNHRVLPVAIYYPQNTEDATTTFVIMYVIELFLGLLVGVPSLLGFDFLFLSVIVHIVNELRMLKYKIEALPEQPNLVEVNSLIDHHNIILQSIKHVNQSYSMLLLNQFVTSTFIIFLGLLSIISDGFPPPFERFVKPVPYIISYTGMMFLYCYSGSLLITESQNVANAAYNTKWWMRTQPEFRRRIILMVQRAHKVEKLTAGRMFDLNLSSFTNVIRMSFSFLTLVQAILTRNSDRII